MRTVRNYIYRGIVATVLAPAGEGKNRRLRRMIIIDID